MKFNVDTCYIKHKEKRVCQGDIFRDIKYNLSTEIKKNKIIVNEMTIPYLIILSQECDLDLDFKYRHDTKYDTQDKYLQSILVSPAYLAERVRMGTHLEDLQLKMESYNSKKWPDIKSNQNIRYHYLQDEERLKIPELILDFKHYYTIPVDFFYKKFNSNYVATLEQMFREHLSQRFAHYLSRIGLPTITTEEK